MVKAIIFDFFGVLAQDGSPNQALVSYIRNKLKPVYKIGIISNAAGEWTSEILSKNDVALFDDITISYRTGVAKPNPEIYSAALKKLRVEASEAIFIDDIEAYCQAARQLGMQAIHYRNFKQFEQELKKLLDSSAAVADN